MPEVYIPVGVSEYKSVKLLLSGTEAIESIPLVYGKKWVQGKVILFGGKDTGFSVFNVNIKFVHVPFWIAICFGKISVLNIREKIDDTYKYYSNPHSDPAYGEVLSENFNDGTGTFYPTSAGIVNNAGVTLPYTSKLKGIAHQYFNIFALARMRLDIIEGQPIDNYEFEVQKTLSGSAVVCGDLADGSNNPVTVIYDLLTNAQYGCSIDPVSIDIASFNEAAQYIYAKNIGIDLIVYDSIQCREVIDNICSVCLLQLWKDRNGIYNIRAYDPDHVTNYDDTMGDTDFIDFSISRKQFHEMPTEIKFRYRWAWGGNDGEDIYTLANDGIYLMNGEQKITEEIDITMLSPNSVGALVNKLAYRMMYPINTIKCTTNMKYAHLEPMDVVIVTNTEADINNMPFRVKTIDYGDVGENKIKFTLEQAIEFSGSVDAGLTDGYRENPAYSENTDTENLTFTKFYEISTAFSTTFTNVNNVIVRWGANQVNTGLLEYITDYTIVDNNKIRLTEPKWTSTIEANSLGLLNVDVYEAL